MNDDDDDVFMNDDVFMTQQQDRRRRRAWLLGPSEAEVKALEEFERAAETGERALFQISALMPKGKRKQVLKECDTDTGGKAEADETPSQDISEEDISKPTTYTHTHTHAHTHHHHHTLMIGEDKKTVCK